VTIADDIFAIFNSRGSAAYFGEPVSVTEHGLQAAHFAQEEHASAGLVLAALLHDIGHLVVDCPDDITEWTDDAHHERIGSGWLARRFGPEVSEPVRLHVPAKRYLCATRPEYFGKLSPASVLTLKLQGGLMTDAEVTAFEAEPFFREALRLREWDDRGKIPGLETPDLGSYRALIEARHVQRQRRSPD
jgi:[1-hydroxy-2-(trimethylamino)ethyl]phosphonate dioxygenase